MKFLTCWIIYTLALLAVTKIVVGVSVDNWQTAVITALVISLLNSFIKPILLLLTLPINIMTLGLFTLFINAIIFSLAAWLVKGFHVGNFWNAFWAAFLFSVISFFLDIVFPGIR